MSIFRWLLAHFGALLLAAFRVTCRYRIVNDPRPSLRAQGRPYIIALLHAHQLAAIMANREARSQVMVSRSADGDMIVPALRQSRVYPARGSTRSTKNQKGGQEALKHMTENLRSGCVTYLTVDGPRGPRATVHRGVARMAVDTGAPILPILYVPTHRWVLNKSWDRFQIPKPFCRIDIFIASEIEPEGKSVETVRTQCKNALAELEAAYDPSQAS